MSDSFNCDECSKTYKTANTLKTHKEKMHKTAATVVPQTAPVAQPQPTQPQPTQPPAKKAPAKSASATPAKSTKAAPAKSTKAAPAKSTSAASAKQTKSAQQQAPQQQQSQQPTRRIIVTTGPRENVEASNTPTRPPDTLETLRSDIDELRMLVYALIRTHYIQTLTEKHQLEQSMNGSTNSEECEDECTCCE